MRCLSPRLYDRPNPKGNKGCLFSESNHFYPTRAQRKRFPSPYERSQRKLGRNHRFSLSTGNPNNVSEFPSEMNPEKSCAMHKMMLKFCFVRNSSPTVRHSSILRRILHRGRPSRQDAFAESWPGMRSRLFHEAFCSRSWLFASPEPMR